MKLIGITGYKRAGKSTVANYFYEKKGYLEYAFADPIYRMLSGLFSNPFSESHYALTNIYRKAIANKEAEISLFHGRNISLRTLTTTLGTEYGREILAKDFWILFADFQYRYWLSMGVEGMVVSDVRFENEAQWLLDKPESQLIEIKRSKPSDASHASEQYEDWLLKYPHHTITNYGTIIELHEQLDKLLNE